ncbi:10880_t:CDS:2, partial [Racocetra persica]
GRYAAASVLVGYRLYFIGGQFQNGTISSELFYLDLSTSFNTSDVISPRWSDPSPAPIASAWATATVCGANESIIFLIGGMMVSSNNTNNTIAYSFNTNTGNWSNITTSDVLNQRRIGSSLSYDPDPGIIYIFGGQSIFNLSEWFDEMIIFDSIHFSWSNKSFNSGPSKISGHTATLLKTGIIVFIGGLELSNTSSTPTLANMSQIWTYNTSSAEWSSNNAIFINTPIDSRVYHSAVLAHEDKIIIYGGSNGTDNSRVLPDLAVLNVSSTQFQWSTPNITPLSSTPSLAAHTAVMVDDYMILLFGNVTGSNSKQSSINNIIYFLNTTSYDWVTLYQSSNLPMLIGMVIGSSVLAFIIGYSALSCYRKHRIKHTSLITKTHGDETREVLHYPDNNNPTKLEGYHCNYFDNVSSQNSSETPVTTFHYIQPLVFQHHIMSADSAPYNHYPENEGNVPVINYAHDIQPQYVEYDMTHNNYPNPT